MTADIAQPLAIDGGPPVRTAPWPTDPPPQSAPDPDPRAAIVDTLATQLGIDAERIALFADQEQAAVAALRYAVTGGGELLVPALAGGGWVAPAERVGLTAVPVEVDAETGAIAPGAVAAAISGSPSVRAVVAVHPFGHPAALTEIELAIRTTDVAMIEDAGWALGASERRRAVGAIGAAGLLRLGAPDDPAAPFALVTPSVLETTGAALDDAAAQAALAWVRAEPEAQAVRRRLAWELTFGLRGMRGVAGMHHGRHVRVAYHHYIARLRRIVWKRPIDDTVEALRAEGIACALAFPDPPLHADPAARAALGERQPPPAAAHFAVAERLPAEWIAIPLPAAATQRDVDDAVAALRKIEAAGA